MRKMLLNYIDTWSDALKASSSIIIRVQVSSIYVCLLFQQICVVLWKNCAVNDTSMKFGVLLGGIKKFLG